MLKSIAFLTATLVWTAPIAVKAHHFADLGGSPGLQSASAIVIDEQGNVVYDKGADTVRSIASITKLMTAIVVLQSGQDLEEPITVTRADRDLIRLTGSRLEYGATLSRREMLMLALMASENRAASALGRNWPGGTDAFVREMNAQARALGMEHSHFADPVGLKTENRSTARDLARLLDVARGYPLITKASTTPQLQVYPYSGRGPLTYVNTNRLLRNATWDISLSKTGYINDSGRCLVMEAIIDGERLSIVFLDSFGKLTPFGDSNRLRRWLTSRETSAP